MRIPAVRALMAGIALCVLAGPLGAGGCALVRESIVAGGPSDFLQVSHAVFRGSHVEIGRELARLARERHGVEIATPDPALTRAQRRYFENTIRTSSR